MDALLGKESQAPAAMTRAVGSNMDQEIRDHAINMAKGVVGIDGSTLEAPERDGAGRSRARASPVHRAKESGGQAVRERHRTDARPGGVVGGVRS